MRPYSVPTPVIEPQPKPEGRNLGNIKELLDVALDPEFLILLPAIQRKKIEQLASTIRVIMQRDDIDSDEKQRVLEDLVPRLMALINR